MSRKHKQKHSFFNRRNNDGIKTEKAALDLSKLRIRAGMAAVSALLILSPVVISAAGSIANPAVQENTGISDPEQKDSPYWLSADDSGTGNTAADTGSTLAADPQNIGVFPADNDKEGTASNDTSTRQQGTKDDEVPKSDKSKVEKDEEVPETGGTSQEEESEEKLDDSNTSQTSQSGTSKEEAAGSPVVDTQKDASVSEMTADGSSSDSHSAAAESQTSATNAGRDQNEVSTDKNDSSNADGTGGGKEDPDADPNENADSADASDDGSEDHEDVDGGAASTGVTDTESTEDSNGQDSEQDNENENGVGFSSYGSNDFPGAITPDIVRIPADEWTVYGESAASFLERGKDFFASGTPVFFDLKGAEYSAAIRNDCFEIEKTEDGTAVVLEAASLKDGTGVYENVVEYIIRNAGSTTDGEKVDLVLSLDEARIELPEDSKEEASRKIAVFSVSNDRIFRAEARSIPAGTEDDDADRKNEAEALDVRASERWSARIIRHEGDDVAEPRTFLLIPDLDEVFGDPASETCDRERVAMLSGFSGKAFCCEDAAVSVSSSGYLEGNGQADAVILPINIANFQFAWGGTNCSTDLFTGFDRIEPEKSPEKDTADKDDLTGPDKTPDVEEDADSDAETKTETNKEDIPADEEESIAESTASGAAILISYEEEPEKAAGFSAGDTVEISMKVKNIGSGLLTDVEVNEILDDDAKIAVAWDRSSDPDTGENVLSEGETVPFTVNYTVTQDDIDAGKLVRKAEASAETTERDEVEDEQTSEVILRRAASIDFSKEAAVQKISDAREGMSVQYYFTVINSGNVTLRNIEVIDQMAGLSRIVYDWNESTDSRTGEGYLSPGEKVTASAAYTITSGDIQKGRIVNKAYARGETLQGKIIESSRPEAPTSISQEGKEENSYGTPATGDDTDIYTFLTLIFVSAAVLIGAVVLGKIQKKKMDFDNEGND